MGLSRTERAALFALQFRLDEPLVRTAGEAGISEKTLRTTLHRLCERGIIRPASRIQASALGFRHFSCLVRLNAAGRASAASVIEAISTLRSVQWCAEYAGEYDIGFGICGRDEEHVDSILAALFGVLGDVADTVIVLKERTWTRFPRKYLGFRQTGAEFPVMETKPVVTHDRIDVELLDRLTIDGSATLAQLARHLRLPQSTVSYRLKRLREQHVLMGIDYALHFQTAGILVQSLLLRVSYPSPAVGESLRRIARAHPNITALGRYYGAWDYEVLLEGESPKDLRNAQAAVTTALGAALKDLAVAFVVTVVPRHGALLSVSGHPEGGGKRRADH